MYDVVYNPLPLLASAQDNPTNHSPTDYHGAHRLLLSYRTERQRWSWLRLVRHVSRTLGGPVGPLATPGRRSPSRRPPSSRDRAPQRLGAPAGRPVGLGVRLGIIHRR